MSGGQWRPIRSVNPNLSPALRESVADLARGVDLVYFRVATLLSGHRQTTWQNKGDVKYSSGIHAQYLWKSPGNNDGHDSINLTLPLQVDLGSINNPVLG